MVKTKVLKEKCPKCGGVLIQEKTNLGGQSVYIISCITCGYFKYKE